MSEFVKKASSKIDKLSSEQILRLIQNQQQQLALKDNILNNVQEGFLLVNRDYRILYHNSYLAQILSINTRYSTLDNFFREPDLVDFIRKTVAGKGKDNEFFFNITNSRFGEMEIRTTYVALKNEEAYLFSFKDFTFFRKLYEEFRRSESLAAMTTMAAGVAHEIKNPLASISIYLQILQRKLDKNGILTEEDAKKSFDVISEEIERLNKIAVDFLFAVKPLNVNPRIKNINESVKIAVELAKAEAESNGISIQANYASALPAVKYDSGLIEQCILNLLKNSIQSIEQGKDGLIKITTYLDANNVKIDVSDNGCGMSEEVLNKIFEPYYTTKASGTGLGLTNIFKIMKEHEGDINVSSTLGEGSVFTLSLPVPKSQRFRIQDGNL